MLSTTLRAHLVKIKKLTIGDTTITGVCDFESGDDKLMNDRAVGDRAMWIRHLLAKGEGEGPLVAHEANTQAHYQTHRKPFYEHILPDNEAHPQLRKLIDDHINGSSHGIEEKLAQLQTYVQTHEESSESHPELLRKILDIAKNYGIDVSKWESGSGGASGTAITPVTCDGSTYLDGTAAEQFKEYIIDQPAFTGELSSYFVYYGSFMPNLVFRENEKIYITNWLMQLIFFTFGVVGSIIWHCLDMENNVYSTGQNFIETSPVNTLFPDGFVSNEPEELAALLPLINGPIGASGATQFKQNETEDGWSVFWSNKIIHVSTSGAVSVETRPEIKTPTTPRETFLLKELNSGVFMLAMLGFNAMTGNIPPDIPTEMDLGDLNDEFSLSCLFGAGHQYRYNRRVTCVSSPNGTALEVEFADGSKKHVLISGLNLETATSTKSQIMFDAGTGIIFDKNSDKGYLIGMIDVAITDQGFDFTFHGNTIAEFELPEEFEDFTTIPIVVHKDIPGMTLASYGCIANLCDGKIQQFGGINYPISTLFHSNIWSEEIPLSVNTACFEIDIETWEAVEITTPEGMPADAYPVYGVYYEDELDIVVIPHFWVDTEIKWKGPIGYFRAHKS